MSPDEHAAEAEELLKHLRRVTELQVRLWPPELMLEEARVHALLASRPTETEREHFDGPSRMELVRELREAVGLSTAASPMSPRVAWLEALDRARHLAELSQGAVTLAAHEVVRQERDEWERETTRVEQHRDGLHAEVLDLRWLIGHLARNAPDTVMLPPRLAPLVKECMDGYDPSCYTLAEPVPSTGEDQPASTNHGIPNYAMLDVWSALGGGPLAFDRMWQEDRRTPADTWSQLLAVIRGDLDDLLADTNPPQGPEFEALVRRRTSAGEDQIGMVPVDECLTGGCDIKGPDGSCSRCGYRPVQWTGDNVQEIEGVFGPEKVTAVHPYGLDKLTLLAGKYGAQGWVVVPLGHWIVRKPGDASDYWPVADDYFAAKYEPVPSGEGGDQT